MADMTVYSRHLAARHLSERLLIQHSLEGYASDGTIAYHGDQADRQFRELAEAMGYDVALRESG